MSMQMIQQLCLGKFLGMVSSIIRRIYNAFYIFIEKSNTSLLGFIYLDFISCHVYAASFDCNKASNTAEKEICNNPKLSKLDEEIAEQYKMIFSLADEDTRKVIRANQSKWLKKNTREID